LLNKTTTAAAKKGNDLLEGEVEVGEGAKENNKKATNSTMAQKSQKKSENKKKKVTKMVAVVTLNFGG
jgi:hypothetical protein